MKKLSKLLLIIAILGLGFNSCEKEEMPGEIPGMGNAGGELEVKSQFVEPEGIEISGLTGVSYNSPVSAQGFVEGKGYPKSGSINMSNFSRYGSGGQWVKIKVNLKNTRNDGRCVWFPRGLVFKVSHPEYQNAILLCWTPVWVDANSTREIVLDVYCINKGKNGSDENVTYTIMGVTSSVVINKLLELIGWRMINIEFYQSPYQNAKTKSLNADDFNYNNMVVQLQDALWTLTNDGKELSQAQIDYINSLPMMPEGSYPANLDDEGALPPSNWREYAE